MWPLSSWNICQAHSWSFHTNWKSQLNYSILKIRGRVLIVLCSLLLNEKAIGQIQLLLWHIGLLYLTILGIAVKRSKQILMPKAGHVYNVIFFSKIDWNRWYSPLKEYLKRSCYAPHSWFISFTDFPPNTGCHRLVLFVGKECYLAWSAKPASKYTYQLWIIAVLMRSFLWVHQL